MAENFRGGSLVDWRIALESVNPSLANRLHEAADPYARVNELGLPIPPYVSFENVADFVNDPTKGMAELTDIGIEQFYVGLRPTKPDLAKYRELGLQADAVTGYIQSVVDESNYGDYALRVAEYAVASYGATMIVNPSGKIRLEMVNGEMANLATGVQTPDYVAESDQFTGIMRYSFDSTRLRCAVWNAMSKIPRIDNGTGWCPQRVPGYYEFSLIERLGHLAPVFLDYIENPLFTIPE